MYRLILTIQWFNNSNGRIMLSIAIKFSFYPEKEKNLLRFCSEQLFKVARAWNVDRLISRFSKEGGSWFIRASHRIFKRFREAESNARWAVIRLLARLSSQPIIAICLRNKASKRPRVSTRSIIVRPSHEDDN